MKRITRKLIKQQLVSSVWAARSYFQGLRSPFCSALNFGLRVMRLGFNLLSVWAEQQVGMFLRLHPFFASKNGWNKKPKTYFLAFLFWYSLFNLRFCRIPAGVLTVRQSTQPALLCHPPSQPCLEFPSRSALSLVWLRQYSLRASLPGFHPSGNSLPKSGKE